MRLVFVPRMCFMLCAPGMNLYFCSPQVPIHLHSVPTIQSEIGLVHAKVHEPHPHPLVHMNFPGLPFTPRARGRRFVRTGRFRCGFANVRMNQPCLAACLQNEVCTNDCFELRNLSRNMLWIFEPWFVRPKNPTNFSQNFQELNQERFTDELLQMRRENISELLDCRERHWCTHTLELSQEDVGEHAKSWTHANKHSLRTNWLFGGWFASLSSSGKDWGNKAVRLLGPLGLSHLSMDTCLTESDSSWHLLFAHSLHPGFPPPGTQQKQPLDTKQKEQGKSMEASKALRLQACLDKSAVKTGWV